MMCEKCCDEKVYLKGMVGGFRRSDGMRGCSLCTGFTAPQVASEAVARGAWRDLFFLA